MSRAAICGSDLHIYRGTQNGPSEPFSLGHEGIGYIDEIGSGVGSLAIGDPVVIPFILAEGHMYTSLTTSMCGGIGNGGDLGGTQAEYIGISFADGGFPPVRSFNCPNPSTNETDSLTNDYVMLSDIFATGWAGLDYAGFNPGDTVAIFGAGSFGLRALHAAMLRGASTVYSVDYVSDRLETAGSLGAIPINFQEADPVEQIMALELNGVTRSIDAVGYEQVNRNLAVQAGVIIMNMLGVTSAGGGMGTVGIYAPRAHNSSTAPRAATVQDTVDFPISDFFFGESTWGAGPSYPIELAPLLIQLVSPGRANLGLVVSDVVGIEEAPKAYRRFERHEIRKAVIAFD